MAAELIGETASGLICAARGFANQSGSHRLIPISKRAQQYMPMQTILLVMRNPSSLLRLLSGLAILLIASPAPAADAAWTRHTIDDSSRGADGVRLADANGDGLLDIVTGWEQGSVTRLYLNPGPAKAREKWPAVTIGKTPS